jgi:hypothetical protein
VAKIRGFESKSPRMRELYPDPAFSSGGAFKEAPGEDWWRMRGVDLVKAVAITVDVDIKNFPPLSAALGLSAEEVKASLYNSTQDEVEELIEKSGFYASAIAEAAATGFPSQPNRLVFTGHGCCMIYWLDPESGWVDPLKGSGLSWSRVKATIFELHEKREELGLWWWDEQAKDVGTRLFPLPGEFHRECGDPRFEPNGKWVGLRASHDRIETGWLEGLERRFPAPEAKPKRDYKRGGDRPPKAAPAAPGAASPTSWTHEDWTPDMEPLSLEIGGRGPCPKCGSDDALRKFEPLRHTCFKCKTRFLKIDADLLRLQQTPMEAPTLVAGGGELLIPSDERGYAVFPSQSPEVVVIKTGTGSGKTHYMALRAKEWMDLNGAPDWAVHPQDRWTVLGLAPTKNLATQAAARWGIPYAGANDSLRYEHGSAVTCFAAVSGFASSAVPEDLGRTLVIIDELEPQCRQVVSMLKGQRAADSHAKLAYILAHAGAVIIGDAHAGEVTAQVLEHANVYRKIKNKEPRTFSTWTSPPRRYGFRYVSGAPEDSKTQASSYSQHLDLIRHEVSLHMRPAIFCASKYIAMALHETLSSVFLEKRGYCVVGGKGTDEYQDLSQSALTADWLIFTTAMSTGVSYDVPGHYHGTHVILEQGFAYLTGPVIEQAIHRVRKPITSTITISGNWTDLRDHLWMADPEQVLKRASRKEVACRALSKRLAGIGAQSRRQGRLDIEQLAVTQATALASDVRCGLKAVLAWLKLRHDFVFYDLPDDVDVGMRALVSEASKRIKDEEAADTAEQVPLKPWQVDRVLHRGHKDEQERRQLNKTLAVNLYGDAYDGLAKGRKAKTTRRHLFSSLEEEVIIAARVKAMLNSPKAGAVKVVQSDEKRNRYTSFVVSERFASRVGAVWRALRMIFDSAEESASSWPLRDNLLEAIVTQVRQGHSGAILGWVHMSEDHLGSVRKILKYAGIRVSNKRTGDGNERCHFLKRSSIDAIFTLAEEEHRRLVSMEYQEDETFF